MQIASVNKEDNCEEALFILMLYQVLTAVNNLQKKKQNVYLTTADIITMILYSTKFKTIIITNDDEAGI